MLNAYCAFPRIGILSDIMQLARTYSGGTVPDLHRVPCSSIAGTYSGGNDCLNIDLCHIIDILYPFVKIFKKHFPCNIPVEKESRFL